MPGCCASPAAFPGHPTRLVWEADDETGSPTRGVSLGEQGCGPLLGCSSSGSSPTRSTIPAMRRVAAVSVVAPFLSQRCSLPRVAVCGGCEPGLGQLTYQLAQPHPHSDLSPAVPFQPSAFSLVLLITPRLLSVVFHRGIFAAPTPTLGSWGDVCDLFVMPGEQWCCRV